MSTNATAMSATANNIPASQALGALESIASSAKDGNVVHAVIAIGCMVTLTALYAISNGYGFKGNVRTGEIEAFPPRQAGDQQARKS